MEKPFQNHVLCSIETKTDRFIGLWLAAKKLFFKNQWLQPPKPGSRDYEKLDKARKVADELGGNYPEYIQVQVDAFRYYHKFPLPSMVGTDRAIKRYKSFLLRHRKSYTSLYTLDGDTFIVANTGVSYPMAQVESTLSEDSVASYASHISNSLPEIKEGNREKVVRALEYYFAKLAYKKKIPPDTLFRALEVYKGITDEEA